MDNTIKPKLIIDTREQNPLVFRELPSEGGTLYSGDYSIAGFENVFAIERKDIADLVKSVTTDRERFEHELHRLRGFHFARLLIVGSRIEIKQHRYRSRTKPLSVLNSLRAFEVRYPSVYPVFIPTPEKAAELIESWAIWYFREQLKPWQRIGAVIDGTNLEKPESIRTERVKA